MPYYRWKGITIQGMMQSGVECARSSDELIGLLFAKEIALLSYSLKKQLPFLTTVSLSMRVAFFRNLAILLSSGIFLDQALQLVLHQVKQRYFKDIINDIAADIAHGISLSAALHTYAHIFDPLTLQMVQTAQETGSLAQSLHRIADHQELLLEFNKRIRSIVLMPALTFSFFLIIAGVIFIVIVPSFNAMINSTNHSSCSLLFINGVSEFLRSWYAGASAVGITGIGVLMHYLCTTHEKIKRAWQWVLIKTPFINAFIAYITWGYYFQSLALLTQAGVHLVDALLVANQSIGNIFLKEALEEIRLKVEQGFPLAHVMQEKKLFSDHSMALIQVGQESGCLPFVFNQVSSLYKQQLNERLTTISTLLQPLLIIILGLLITLLVCVVYIPLFTLSSTIG